MITKISITVKFQAKTAIHNTPKPSPSRIISVKNTKDSSCRTAAINGIKTFHNHASLNATPPPKFLSIHRQIIKHSTPISGDTIPQTPKKDSHKRKNKKKATFSQRNKAIFPQNQARKVK